MGGTVLIGTFKPQHDIAVLVGREPFISDGGASDVAACDTKSLEKLFPQDGGNHLCHQVNLGA